jgi:hypothetical protein
MYNNPLAGNIYTVLSSNIGIGGGEITTRRHTLLRGLKVLSHFYSHLFKSILSLKKRKNLQIQNFIVLTANGRRGAGTRSD